jgi:hypothetical protein
MEKDKHYYSLRPHRSPLPQWLAMPRPYSMAQPESFGIAHAVRNGWGTSRARAARGQCAPACGHCGQTHDLAGRSSARW